MITLFVKRYDAERNQLVCSYGNEEEVLCDPFVTCAINPKSGPSLEGRLIDISSECHKDKSDTCFLPEAGEIAVVPEGFEGVIREVKNWDVFFTDANSKKIIGKNFQAGDRFYLVYKEDIKWAKEEFDGKEITPENCENFGFLTSGIIVPIPGTEIRGEIDPFETCFLCIDDYSTEKCYPDVDYVGVAKVCFNPELKFLMKAAKN